MIASVDGRTLLRRWRPVDESRGKLFERLNEEFGSDAWLVGRVTGQEYTAPFERALSRSVDHLPDDPFEPEFEKRAIMDFEPITAFSFSRVRSDPGILCIGVLLRRGRPNTGPR